MALGGKGNLVTGKGVTREMLGPEEDPADLDLGEILKCSQ